MSPQRSNRRQLIEGTLRCLERLPAERITTRAIAEESDANVASIAYHFGSKDDLVTEAVVEGLDLWLEEIAGGEPAVLGEATERRLLRAVLAEERRERKATAVELGARLFAEVPGDFVGRIGAYWRASGRC